jgi:hypothetical protein
MKNHWQNLRKQEERHTKGVQEAYKLQNKDKETQRQRNTKNEAGTHNRIIRKETGLEIQEP